MAYTSLGRQGNVMRNGWRLNSFYTSIKSLRNGVLLSFKLWKKMTNFFNPPIQVHVDVLATYTETKLLIGNVYILF